MTLYFIGLGLCDEQDLPARGLALLRSCPTVFAESYTNRLAPGTLARLEKTLGQSIVLLSREHVEGEKTILDAAKQQDCALIIPGDPLVATTHVSLILAARKAKIPVRVIHAASIISAAMGESGLQSYRFGPSVTLPYWRPGFEPVSTLDVLEANRARGLHTLLFLDIDEKLGGPMPLAKALELLDKMQEKSGKTVLKPTDKLVVLSRIGYDDQKILFGMLKKLRSAPDPGVPAIIAVPGKMHFLEEEYLEEYEI